MHLSLIAVWLGTALVSAIEHRGLSVQVLADAGIHDARWQTFLIWSGRKSYLAALLLMAAMTVLATALQPTLWLHPLGPLLKNLPIAAMLLHLMSAPVTSKESA